jgi:hypothetical protein
MMIGLLLAALSALVVLQAVVLLLMPHLGRGPSKERQRPFVLWTTTAAAVALGALVVVAMSRR